MKFLQQLKLTQRFTVLIACVALGFAVYGAWSFKTLSDLKVGGPLYHEIVEGKDIVADILPPPEYIIESYLVSLQLATGEKSERDSLIARLKALKADYDTRHQYWGEQHLADSIAKPFLETAYAPALQFYKIAFEDFIPALQADDKEGAASAMSRMRAAYEAHRKAIDEEVQIANKRVEDNERLAQQQVSKATMLMLLVLVIALALTVIIAVLISRSVIQPMTQMRTVMREIREKSDFTRSLDVESHDEVGETAQSFNELVSSLRQTLLRLLDNAKDVSKAARELTAAAEQSATSSEQQSEASSSIAAAIEEMNASLSMVTDSAREAHSISENSGQLSTQGGSIIHNAATAMVDIAQSVRQTSSAIEALGGQSREISSVVQVIKDVAEQTNLLALNAAIEAARAGEQGRGFAVVADEVRKLAERTSKATEEISEMIKKMQDSTGRTIDAMNAVVGKADEGANIARQAGEAITQIQAGSGKVVEVVNDISSALNEQSAASEEIAAQVERVAQNTEENSASAAQTAGAAGNLQHLSEDMRSTVSKFKL